VNGGGFRAITKDEADQVRIRDAHGDRSVLDRYYHLGVRQYLTAPFGILLKDRSLAGFQQILNLTSCFT
jgi:hypothetical protein